MPDQDPEAHGDAGAPRPPAKKATAKKATAKKATAKKGAASTSPPTPRTPSFPPDDDAVERPWLASYPPLVPESYPYPDVGLPRLLDDAAKDFPDSVAMDFMGRTLTYRRLLDHVDRFAAALAALGVGKGERVGIALPNAPQHVVAFFAVLRLGAVVAEIDPRLDERSLAARINDAGCRVLVVLDPVYAKVERLKGKVPTVEHVVGSAIADYLPPLGAARFNWRHRRDTRLVRKIPASEGVLRFNELVRRSPPNAPQEPLTPDADLALLIYPEGQDRSIPRGVMLTHRNVLANVFQVRLWVPDVQAGRETILCAAPFSQPYGLVAGLMLGVLSAASMALVPATEASDILQVVDKSKPTLFPATGTMISQLVGAPHLRRHELASIRACLTDGTHIDADAVKAFEEATGGKVREGLTLVEATAMTHANPVYGKAKAGRVGLPLSDTLCALVDPRDGTRLSEPGQPGELAVHGPQVMKGYWHRPDETSSVLAGGWLRTGLLAEVDDEGYYCVVGRTDASQSHDSRAGS